MIRLACLGDNCVDYYDETETGMFGGNPVNVAVYARRMGHVSSYLGAVGTDSFGCGMTEALKAKGVDISHVQIKDGKTALTHVTVRDGDRVFGDFEEGVMADFSLREEDFAFIGEHSLAVSGIWGHCENDLGRIREMGIPVAFDCSDQLDDPRALQAIRNSDSSFFSDDKSTDEVLEQKIREIREEGPELVVATRGERGSLAFDGSEFVRCGIIPCEVVDTMGAGDSFIAGFLCARLSGKALKECMEAGAEQSVITLSYSGAWK